MNNGVIFVGMDEAGRGSWAGPVVAGAVILKKGTRLPGLTDSKKLTAKKREQLYELIIRKCDHGIGIATHQEVDQHGLLKATELAYKRALNQLKGEAHHILIDGRDKFSFKLPHTSIIKGDLKERCISAASILAKVHRDQIMRCYGKGFPAYAFEKHMGYGTKRHHQALKEHGVTHIHRTSYAPIAALFEQHPSSHQ